MDTNLQSILSKLSKDQRAAIEAEQKKGEAAQAKLATKQKISFKVSAKGAVSVYGLNARFPTTLYGEQWKRLLAKSEELLAYIDEHKSELSTRETES